MTTPRVGRDFELVIRVRGGDVVVKPPLQIEFQADKSIRGQLNKIQIKLYNLNEKNRLALVRDAEGRTNIPLSLAVGYESRLELVFKGTIHTAGSQRQGADIVTTIEGLDGGFDLTNSYTSRTVEGGKRAIDAALKDMPNTTVGKIRQRPVLTRPKILVGSSVKLIEDMIGDDETFYIDDEQLYIVGTDEVTSRFIPVVSAATGLISTPERKNKEVTFQTLMNPSIKIGRRVKLISKTAPHLDGIYKMDTISYQGSNYGSEWSQTCTGRLSAGAVVI
jgi:hypothetical protein